MNVDAGSRPGPYEIVSRIGAGGMGEVWLAKDTRLDRSVAIKILPAGFAQNEQFRARFEREAKTISSLNHPNICTLFDVGHEDGAHFLVMELIEGESLADRLQKGALPPDHVLGVGSQVADALDRAHKQGVVHRDLKPGNVMLTKTGAKLLAFGLSDLRGATMLWLRSMDSATFRQLAGTEDASHPFWSPDSRRVGFFAGGKVKTVDIQGGAVSVICDAANGRGASWNGDGTILVTPNGIGPLMVVKASGGTPTPLTKLRPGDTSHRWPFFLPHGNSFIFLAVNDTAGNAAICQSSLDEPEVITPVVNTSSSAAFVSTGYLVFSRDNLVVAQRYDPGKPATIGEPITLTDRFFALFSASNDGTMVLQRGTGFVLTELS